ncbi:MAG: hypothetical protein ACI8PZ_007415, partial [Myxococcota bacterium]
MRIRGVGMRVDLPNRSVDRSRGLGHGPGIISLGRVTQIPGILLHSICWKDLSENSFLVDGRAVRAVQSRVRLRPEVFVLRLASLLLPPGVNRVRYFGVFAPASP